MAEHPVGVEILSSDECWALLHPQRLGRLAVATSGDVDIFPINFFADGQRILFRTDAGTKLRKLIENRHVALETDEHTDTSAWSVVAKGQARPLLHQSEFDWAERQPLEPWIPTLDYDGPKYDYVVITEPQVSGRRFQRRGQPR
ncbi:MULTISPECIES: pyridoxamine 5'-phosphate oxidase family protein [Bacteria]